MPRRPSKGHKKKANGPRPVDRKAGTIRKWNTADDVELDEEDQFHASRDRILLEGEEQVDDDDAEEEVFALKGMDEDDEDDEDGDIGMDVDGLSEDEEDVPAKSKSKSKASKADKKAKKGKKAKGKKGEDEEDDEDGEEEESWGRNKGAYYVSNAAEVDSEDEEANELEEQEARRLQARTRDAMDADDFGLADGAEEDGDGDAAEEDLDDTAVPAAPAPLPTDKHALLSHLARTNPEALALVRDWDDTARALWTTKAKVEALDKDSEEGIESGLLHMYYQALLTYTTTLAFYIHLRSSPKYAARPELLSRHPIMGRLLSLKQAILSLENIGVGQDPAEDDDRSDLDDDESLDLDDPEDIHELYEAGRRQGLDDEELYELLKDASALPTKAQKKSNKIKSMLPGSGSGSGSGSDSDEDMGMDAPPPPKKKRKTSEKALVFDLVEPTLTLSKKSKSKSKAANGGVDAVDTVADAFGEATFLQDADARDKQARKKSLRFHVSRIEGASTRRQNARAGAVGGDDDLPYRERRKEREAREAKALEKSKGLLGQGGDDLDDVDPEIAEAGRNDNGTTNGKGKRKGKSAEDGSGSEDEQGADGYYELVKKRSSEKKAAKKDAYEAVLAATRAGLEVQDDADGPRGITRAIMKNKGLTPRRSKSVRNPRVKKRQKFEQAKKRVSSQRAVYKGGIGDANNYQGEKSGISKVVKSVKLD